MILCLGRQALLLVLLGIWCGCAGRNLRGVNERPFRFGQDTFSYRNDLVWEYVFDDEKGTTSHRTKGIRPDYTHHCFVVSRTARQFFQFARFAPELAEVSEGEYRNLVNQVVDRDPSRSTPDERRITIPGFSDLFAFSQKHRRLLQEECGGAWRSYFQRGHWRIMLPFSRAGQQVEAEVLARQIRNHRPPVVHLVRFPQLTINHAVLLFDVEESEGAIRFQAYDPYEPERPVPLNYDRKRRVFSFPRNPYYIGGEVNVYEIYRSWFY